VIMGSIIIQALTEIPLRFYMLALP
jgi:hypothetical protein